MGKLEKSLGASIGFRIQNTATASKKVALFPGHYNTIKVIHWIDTADGNAHKVELVYSDEKELVDAGHNVAQVLDDFNAKDVGSDLSHKVKVTACESSDTYRGFRRFIELVGVVVRKIRFTSNSTTGSDPALFNSIIEVVASALGVSPASDKLKLREYRDAGNYDQSWMEIDLTENPLTLDATTIMKMEIPGSADFNIDFVF